MNRDALVLDVREQKEMDGGKLPNAVHIPLSELDKRIGEIASRAGKPVVAYCARGQRSRGAGAALAKAGFKDIYNLQGGWPRGAARGCRWGTDVANVTMYSTGACPYCVQAERLLAAKGVVGIAKIRVDLDPSGARR
jgi:rhodanese-related sulfurtransferase